MGKKASWSIYVATTEKNVLCGRINGRMDRQIKLMNERMNERGEEGMKKEKRNVERN